MDVESKDAEAVRDAIASIGYDEVIPDGAARCIAAWWQEGSGPVAQFASTGAITADLKLVVRKIWDGLPLQDGGSPDEQAIEALYAYVSRMGERGKVEGWASLWVR